MKKLLNTLYVTRQESYLHKERETIVIKNGGEKLAAYFGDCDRSFRFIPIT